MMTAIESLELSIILWNWKIDNPNLPSSACPLVVTKNWMSHCALCEYDGAAGCDDCSMCPMCNKWPTAEDYCRVCGKETDAYIMFNDWYLPTYDKSFFAAVLVEAFQKRLHELEERSE